MNRTFNNALKICFVSMLCFTLVLSGCTKKAATDDAVTTSMAPTATAVATATAAPSAAPAVETAAPTEAPQLESVTLTWHYPQPNAQADLKAVEEAVNKITQDKIKATIKLEPFDFGEYEDKMNTIVSASDDFDIAFTANWLFDYSSNASKGAFVALDDPATNLLAQYGTDLVPLMPELMWNDTKINGKMYGIPSYQIAAKATGVLVQKQFADKYKLDLSSLHKYEDLEPFLEQIKQNEKGIVPWGNAQFFTGAIYGFDDTTPATIRQNDSTYTVVDIAFTTEYEQYLKLARSWYQKGYIHPDIATMKNPEEELLGKGKVAAAFDPTSKPGVEAEEKESWGGNELVAHRITEPMFTGATSGLNAISRTSKNPERAIMFLNLVNSDKDLYNLLSFGIENKHYTKVGENTIKVLHDNGYAPDTNWVIGDVFNGYLQEGQPADTWELTKQLNLSAKASPLLGFSFNEEPVQTELANVDAVAEKYAIGLESGTLETDKYLAEYRKKLKSAGSEKIVEEKQKQLNAWLATKK
ncbi:DUF3502 domain-containing protein [Paenibacillus psychroresistens]|uniref:DUF3502 domain-containing protein n=1 Tax=Paenibacillus psychroresistens TaxID=1778678 RepID=A0A6B8RTN5_9BACL|nr:ABC transporter substrate-binding protein [Paenibacillus psychroresistens]QGQ99257.1 DUF3502 domain-containing protein [Paenibacillus psychroresistens]